MYVSLIIFYLFLKICQTNVLDEYIGNTFRYFARKLSTNQGENAPKPKPKPVGNGAKMGSTLGLITLKF